MLPTKGRYSGYIRPFSYFIDLLIINLTSYYFLSNEFDGLKFHLFISISWIFLAWNTKFYEVYRFTGAFQIVIKIVKQYILFLIINFAYLGYKDKFFDPKLMILFISISFILVSLIKFFIFLFLKKFRVTFGGNFRNVVIIGSGKSVKDLELFFNDNPDYGYKLISIFDLKSNKSVTVSDSLQFIKNNNIDEIYCSISSLSNSQLNEIVDYADNNLKIVKLLPDSQNVLSRNLILDYYGIIPIVSLRKIPLESLYNKLVKRSFDICFSLLVIVFLMSWLVPIMALLIKFESKGPVFFKQKRNGLNYQEFMCYKFRSMHLNPIADIEQVQKNDPRVTKIGAFMRKTSIDELPQFFNVLLGDMSVVGPRPHMVSHTEMYAKKVNKFMVRHFVKPGITGLAQTSGYRGEVETEKDIINRVKYDIFYLENWTLFLDIKIVFMTVYNALKGEEKAY